MGLGQIHLKPLTLDNVDVFSSPQGSVVPELSSSHHIDYIGVAGALSLFLLAFVLIRAGLQPSQQSNSSSSGKVRFSALATSSSPFDFDFSSLFGGKQEKTSKSKTPLVTVPDDFVVPEPRPLTVTRLDWLPTVATGALALAIRLANGVFVQGWSPKFVSAEEADADPSKYALKLGPLRLQDGSEVIANSNRPAVPLVLYEYEASPFCRKVREVCSMLDLVVILKPCPGARKGFAGELKSKGGKMVVPYLEDPNTGTAMYESDDIIDYLYDMYGPGADKVSWTVRGLFAVITSGLAANFRGFKGSKLLSTARPDNQSMQPIELWGYEGSPFVRPVRETLGELGLPHKMVYCARGSQNRDKLLAKTNGIFAVPFISDPNTGVDMFESQDICEYLRKVYTVKKPQPLGESESMV